jgi:hypothetical protein
LLADAVGGFLKVEQRAVRTTRDLVLRPGAMLRAYFDGRRAPYTGPVRYLLLTLAAALVLGVLLELTPIAHLFRDPLLAGDGWWARFPTVTLFLALAAPSIPAAWVYGWLRPKADLTVAERLAVILYADALALLGWTALEVPLALALGGVSFFHSQAVLSIGFWAFWARIAPPVFRESAWTVTWKVTVAMFALLVLPLLAGIAAGIVAGLLARG